MEIDYKDLFKRAYKTFIQAFLATFSLGITGIAFTDLSALYTLATSAAVAGLAAVFSFIGNWIFETS